MDDKKKTVVAGQCEGSSESYEEVVESGPDIQINEKKCRHLLYMKKKS